MLDRSRVTVLHPATPHEAWDALAAPDQFLAQARFADCVEQGGVEGARIRRLVLDSRGQPGLASALTRLDVRLELLSPSGLRGAVRVGRRVWPRFLRVPVLLGGLPASFGQPGVRLAAGLGEAERASLLHAWADEAEAQAAAWDCSLICAKEFTDHEADALAPVLEARGFLRLPSLPGVSLDLPPTFDAYLASMRAPYRRQLRADLQARERLTLHRAQPWHGDVDTHFALYKRIMDRAPYQLERFGRRFFAALAERFAEDSMGFVVSDDEGPLGSAIVLFGTETAAFLLAGLDHPRAKPQRAYPALVAALIEDAIARGCRRMELGQTSYALKTRLGGVLTPRWLFLRARTAWLQRILRHAGPRLFPPWEVPLRRVFRETR